MEGIFAILLPAIIVFIVTRARLESKRLENRRLELASGQGGDGKQNRLLLEDNKKLRERVENLESIVCSVDYELNQKLAKLLDEQRSLAASTGSSPGVAPGAGEAAAV